MIIIHIYNSYNIIDLNDALLLTLKITGIGYLTEAKLWTKVCWNSVKRLTHVDKKSLHFISCM